MKKICKVIMAAAAVVALAVPAMGADKLIVKDAAGTADVFKVDDTGTAIAVKLGLGTTAPAASFHSSESVTTASRGILASQHNNGSQGANIIFRKSRGTEAAPSILLTNDYVGGFVAQFWNGTTYDRSAQFVFRSEGTVTGTSTPMYIAFQTGDTALNIKEAFRISSVQNVIAGNLGGAAAADMATTVTNGFLYIPNVAGALTSCATATVINGHSPVWYDTTNNKICSCRASAIKCTAVLN